MNLDPFYKCKKYNIPLWQCPCFLFVLMGLIIIVAILATYFIANTKVNDPMLVSLIVIGVAFILIIIDFIITRSFERISEASRMKTEFISIVSHQLRSPLTNLKYALEVLITENKSSKKDYYDVLRQNTDKMNDLINKLLIVSRIETGRLPLEKREFSLTDLTKKLVLKFKAYSEASNVKIRIKARKKMPNVLADSFWTEQIIQNLLDNAVRYIKEKGEVEIKIKPHSNMIHFSIEDTGVGIPKEEQKYIFKKFFRSKNVLKYQTQGSGLGLHICKKIIELMNGKIWFKSKEGKGTCFYFCLPTKRT